jgi:hypothetical protein
MVGQRSVEIVTEIPAHVQLVGCQAQELACEADAFDKHH